MLRHITRLCSQLVLVCSLGALYGCDGVAYVLHAAEGQLAIQGHTEPIDDVLASGRLSEEEAEKLRLIVKARQYAVEVIGLNAGGSYTTFYDTSGDPLAYSLSAARQDALVAKTWVFPIIGEVPYLSFFDEGYLRRVESDLAADGYDTLTYELDAYSTLGFFDDPVRSPMLQRHELSLVETIIHELLHNTVYRPGETTFNESLATYVGRTGTIDFLRAEYGEASDWPAIAVAYFADMDATSAFLLTLHADLAAYYGQALSKEEKLAGREAVFAAARARFVAEVQPGLFYPDVFDYLAGLPTNNAWVLANYRYNLDLGLMEQVHAATGRDWAATLDVFRMAAGASDPFAHLRGWVAGHSAGE